MRTCSSCGQENPDSAKFCMECATPLTAHGPSHEVRKSVTVVFCDVTGSTPLGERLDPESMRHVMERYFDEMRAAIEHHGGSVEKFIGDAVMAVFGVPEVHEDDALRAIRAAAEMRDRLTELNKEFERDRAVSIVTRTGVMTGEVVAGDQAVGQRLVTGDAVNTAARLEQAAQPGEILIGADTFRLVRDAVRTELVEPLRLKGKTDPVKAYRLISVSPEMKKSRRLGVPIVGRQRELGSIQQAFERAVSDQACQFFTILGPAGVGKSRLVAEFLARVGEATVLQGRCLSYGEGITYFPVIEVVKQAAGLADFDSSEVIETKVCELFRGDPQQEVVCRRVAQLMGVVETAAPEETFWAIRRLLEAIAHERPLILVFDDIHWGEPTFLDLVEHVADWSREAPILLLCMARPDLLDVRPTWGGGKRNASTIFLEPLSDEECTSMIANLLGSTKVDETISQRITETGEGNPLFMEEMLSMMIEEELVSEEEGNWLPTADLSSVALPPTISALLASRIDRLTSAERAVLEQASVVGQQFYLGAVQALSEDGPADVRPHLMSLMRKELIRPDRSTSLNEESFRFRHLLIRDAAYESLPKELRAELHERFASWLELTAGGRSAEQEEILGYHLEQAYRYLTELGPLSDRGRELARRAADRLGSAGTRAEARGDVSAAMNLFRRSLNLLPTDAPERPGRLYELARSIADTGRLHDAVIAYTQAIEAARSTGDRRIEWRSALASAMLRTTIDPHGTSTDDVRRLAENAIPVFEELGDEEGLARAWRAFAGLEWMPGRYGRAVPLLEHAIEHAKRAADEHEEMIAIVQLTVAIAYGPTPAQEGLALCEAFERRSGGHLLVEAVTMSAKAEFLGMLGNFEEAWQCLDSARAIFEDLGRPFHLQSAAETAEFLEMLAGHLEAAEELGRARCAALERIQDLGHLSTALVDLARTLCAQGRFDESERIAEQARAMGAEDDLATQLGWMRVHSRVLAARGEFDEAVDLALRAVEVSSVGEWTDLQGNVRMNLAEVFRLAGRLGEAAHAAEEAISLYEQKGNIVAAGKAGALLAELR